MEDGPLDWLYSYPRVCVLQHLFGGCPASCNAPEVPTFMRPGPAHITPQVGAGPGVLEVAGNASWIDMQASEQRDGVASGTDALLPCCTSADKHGGAHSPFRCPAGHHKVFLTCLPSPALGPRSQPPLSPSPAGGDGRHAQSLGWHQPRPLHQQQPQGGVAADRSAAHQHGARCVRCQPRCADPLAAALRWLCYIGLLQHSNQWQDAELPHQHPVPAPPALRAVTVARPPSDDVPDALSVIMYAGECPPAAAAPSTLLQSACTLRCWRSRRSHHPRPHPAGMRTSKQVCRAHHSPTHPPTTTSAAMSTPKLSPFVPIYKGLPGDALPPELATVTPEGEPDAVSLFWRARKLQALVFQVSAAGRIEHCWLHGRRHTLAAAARSHAS